MEIRRAAGSTEESRPAQIEDSGRKAQELRRPSSIQITMSLAGLRLGVEREAAAGDR